MTSTVTQQGHHLIASDRVEGTAVFNREGERLGTIRNFMVDKLTGRAEFAVMQFGGLFGLGSDYYPLPWTKLSYDVDRGGYVVDISRAEIDKAPRYSALEPDFDRDYDDMVRAYYDRQRGPFI